MAEPQSAQRWHGEAFRWVISVLTALTMGRVVWDWFDRRKRLRLDALHNPGAFGNYIIVHTNSSLRTHLALAFLIGIGLLQILLVWVWQSRIASRWWGPPVVEVVLCVAFGVSAAQVAGHYFVMCAGSSVSGHCVVSTPYVLHNGWLGVWALIGLVIGLAWTLTARLSSSDETSHPGASAEVASIA